MDKMFISATYICPVRGLAALEPPEPILLGRAAKTAKNLGLECLRIPVVEEALSGSVRHKVTFLDGLVRALDQVEGAGLKVLLIATAQKIMGLNWVAPYLASGFTDPKAAPVFVEGKLRNLRPYQWWSDPSIIRRRVELFRDLVSAVAGHPALYGWLIMDGALEWPRPEPQVADFVLKSYCAEIRDRDEKGDIWLSLGATEFLYPGLVRLLAPQVNGLCIRVLENDLDQSAGPPNLAKEICMSAYLCALAKWLFGSRISVEIGWSMITGVRDPEGVFDAISVLARQAPDAVNWLSLMDPENGVKALPPWRLIPGLERAGLLDYALEPKKGIEDWIKEIRSNGRKKRNMDFIDIDREEYISDPLAHFYRLWRHFQ